MRGSISHRSLSFLPFLFVFRVYAGRPFRYDIRKYQDWTLTKIAAMDTYLNSVAVRRALHVLDASGGNHTWNSGDGESVPNRVSQALAAEIEKPGALGKLGG